MADLAASSKDNSRNRTPSTASTPSDPSTLPPRPKLHPAPFPYNPSPSSLLSSSSKAAPSEHPKWTPVISCPAYFPLEVYEKTIQEFCLLPERNSTCILRADILEDVEVIEKLSDEIEMENLELEGMDLRSDTKHEHPQEVKGGSWIPFRKLRLNLLPRKPGVDKPLEQECLFLQRRRRSPDTSLSQNDGNALGTAEQEEQEDSVIQDSMVIMSPLVEKEQDVPFYHPPVRKLAIRWTRISQDPTLSAPKTGLTDVHTDQEGSSKPKRYGTLSLSILPFQTFPIPASLKSHDDLKTSDVLPNRLYRTCLSLMEMIGKVGWGKMVGYQKRVLTDTIIDKSTFQDLYLTLKSRHKHLESRVPKKKISKTLAFEDARDNNHPRAHPLEDDNLSILSRKEIQTEDVKRHVWKDVAIATFLMLLWKGMYPAHQRQLKSSSNTAQDQLIENTDLGEEIILPNGKKIRLRTEEKKKDKREWDEWGRPKKGFLDLGCGNGLLVHILISEGYAGKGLELRARKTWPNYPRSTRDHLIEGGIDPAGWFPESLAEWKKGRWDEMGMIEEGMFLIGNHADEMTPWIPLLSLLPPTPIPYLSLPCCLHTLSSLFTKSTFKQPRPHPSLMEDEDGLGKGLDPGRYGSYLKWLGWVGIECGWKWEKEALRIPSTRGWGIVARQRWTQSSEEDWKCREYVMREVIKVREGGGFQVRVKEGKDHGV